MEESAPKQNENFRIIGGNLLIMIAYTGLSKFSEFAPIVDCWGLIIHILICWGFAISQKKWIWFLASLLVLLIGVSTCVKFLFK
ncbi:hypothetical protein BEL04_03305 [Mucilaginibacter sp. PPCGB 2223]|nr:hypothetical protein BEL04_03305 [Mucilaginibacter sp. PPCGB 2223]